jgi:Bacterial Ig domain
MNAPRVPRSQRGFIQYIVLGVVLVLIAATIAVFQSRKPAPSPNDLTASLTGSGGVTITTPDNNATLTSPVHVTANVASGFTGPVRTMQVFRDNTLVYQGAGTTVNTSLTLAAGATHNLTVLALKQNGQLEGSATVNVTVVTATPSPLPLPPSASSVPPLPPVPSP